MKSFNTENASIWLTYLKTALKTNQVFVSGTAVLYFELKYEDMGYLEVWFSSPMTWRQIRIALKEASKSEIELIPKNNEAILETDCGYIILRKYQTDLSLISFHSYKALSAYISATDFINGDREKIINIGQINEFIESDSLVISHPNYTSPNLSIDKIMKLTRLSYEFKKRLIYYPNENMYPKEDWSPVLFPELVSCMMSSCVGPILRSLNNNNVLPDIIPEIKHMSRVPQWKHKQRMDLFEHTIEVVENSSPNIIVRFAALFHDIGKIHTVHFDRKTNKYTFRNHEYVGAYIARNILQRFSCNPDFISRVSKLVQLHMSPTQYQRNPNWTDKAVKRLKNLAGKDQLLLLELAIADKLASQKDIKILEKLYELRSRFESENNLGRSDLVVTPYKISNKIIKLKDGK